MAKREAPVAQVRLRTEWTEHQREVDPTDPVSSDEVIEVHKQLAKFEGSIAELLQPRSA